jgi:hypothetical protein
MCHAVPPARNVFGAQLEEYVLPGAARPLDPYDFADDLPDALMAIEDLDADEDGYPNLDEWLAGTEPGDASSYPGADVCGGNPDKSVWRYDVCEYDPQYVYRKVMLDFCGYSPRIEDIDDLLASPDPQAEIHEVLDTCLASENWRGRDGVLWQVAHRKVRPSAALKAGEDEGDIPLADYEDDYNLFVYTQTDGHDAREMLTAEYHVERSDGDPTTYEPYVRTPIQDTSERGAGVAQLTAVDRRAGLLTSRWNLVLNTMFTPIPRTTAAQAYRAFLGLDIAKMEGLDGVGNEPADYDNKGVGAEECAVCHSTLDPLTYPFSRYAGLGSGLPGQYRANRLLSYVESEGTGILDTPEAGVIFGQEVADLLEWAQVAANSDEFASATTRDYWMLLMGEEPSPDEAAEFAAVWNSFSDTHQYSVDAMLHDIIDTEAYSVP